MCGLLATILKWAYNFSDNSGRKRFCFPSDLWPLICLWSGAASGRISLHLNCQITLSKIFLVDRPFSISGFSNVVHLFSAEKSGSLHLQHLPVWQRPLLRQHWWHGQDRGEGLGAADVWHVQQGSVSGLCWVFIKNNAALWRLTSGSTVSALHQIFKLMKMDSYRRFVRSPLYQKCTLASVEGKVLPELSNESTRLGSWEDVAVRSPLLGGPKVDRCRESEPRDSEVMYSLSCWDLFFFSLSLSQQDKRPDSTSSKKRGSWGGTSCFEPWFTSCLFSPVADSLFFFLWTLTDAFMSQDSLSPNDTHMSIKSTSSVELGSLYRQTEVSVSELQTPPATSHGRMNICTILVK